MPSISEISSVIDCKCIYQLYPTYYPHYHLYCSPHTSLGICTGRGSPHRFTGPGGHVHGLGPRYRHPSTTRARADNFESPPRFSKSVEIATSSSTLSSWRLRNRASFFHIFSSTAGHLFSWRLLGPCETSRWLGQPGSGVLLHRWLSFLIFSSFFFLLTSSLAPK